MPRTYTDDQLTAAVASARRWADVMEALGKGRGASSRHVKAAAERLGLDLAHLKFGPILPQGPHPFQGQKHFGAKGRGGLATAASWFLERGYNVSIPMEPGPYDMIVESDSGLKRVQVKTTRHMDAGSGRHVVRLARNIYDPSMPNNAAGRYRTVQYAADEVDLFFIITGDGKHYLLPFEVTNGQMSLSLEEKYGAFLI